MGAMVYNQTINYGYHVYSVMTNVDDDAGDGTAAIEGHERLLGDVEARNVEGLKEDLSNALVLFFRPRARNGEEDGGFVAGFLYG
ncbi:hypothetical protein BC937DRAFT_94951 [Endogone sp. FLAS-F59071]|nr:hypothetical protein BC937DRAFT_94951 [Endogone sp. FLAS-F59071]|eukprot:RUS20557.1 hypothetical protein BC937DRAFT_94951 [Endogone sp. FLAS-F59071]